MVSQREASRGRLALAPWSAWSRGLRSGATRSCRGCSHGPSTAGACRLAGEGRPHRLALTRPSDDAPGTAHEVDYGETTPPGVEQVWGDLDWRVRRAIGDRQQHRPVNALQGHRERCTGMPDGIGGELAHNQPYVFDEVEESVVDQQVADEVPCPSNALVFSRELYLV